MRECLAPLSLLAEHYLTTCQFEGNTRDTTTGCREGLGPFVRWLDGSLGDFIMEGVRRYIAHLDDASRELVNDTSTST